MTLHSNSIPKKDFSLKNNNFVYKIKLFYYSSRKLSLTCYFSVEFNCRSNIYCVFVQTAHAKKSLFSSFKQNFTPTVPFSLSLFTCIAFNMTTFFIYFLYAFVFIKEKNPFVIFLLLSSPSFNPLILSKRWMMIVVQHINQILN